MPITANNETFYSVQELSQILQTPCEEVADFTKEKKFAKEDEINGALQVKRDDLENLFDEYFSSKNIANERRYKIPDYLKSCSLPWANTLVKMYEKRVNFPASISPEQGELLKSIVTNINPNNVVEIGCFTGISTIWIASGLEQIGSRAIIHSIDLFDEILPWLPFRYGCLLNPYQFAQECVAAAQLSHRIQFYKMNSLEAGKRISEITNDPIDFLFIDGDHTKQGCLSDWMLFCPHVSVGGYIMLHDIYPEHCGWDGPRYVIDEYIKGNPQFELMEIKTSPHNFGMALVRKLSVDKKPEDEMSVDNKSSFVTKALNKFRKSVKPGIG